MRSHEWDKTEKIRSSHMLKLSFIILSFLITSQAYAGGEIRIQKFESSKVRLIHLTEHSESWPENILPDGFWFDVGVEEPSFEGAARSIFEALNEADPDSIVRKEVFRDSEGAEELNRGVNKDVRLATKTFTLTSRNIAYDYRGWSDDFYHSILRVDPNESKIKLSKTDRTLSLRGKVAEELFTLLEASSDSDRSSPGQIKAPGIECSRVHRGEKDFTECTIIVENLESERKYLPGFKPMAGTIPAVILSPYETRVYDHTLCVDETECLSDSEEDIDFSDDEAEATILGSTIEATKNIAQYIKRQTRKALRWHSVGY
jgi:hypothetical protein